MIPAEEIENEKIVFTWRVEINKIICLFFPVSNSQPYKKKLKLKSWIINH